MLSRSGFDAEPLPLLPRPQLLPIFRAYSAQLALTDQSERTLSPI